MLGLFADHRNEFALVLHALGGVGRDDDRLAMRHQRVIGAITDVRSFRQIRLLTALSRRLDDMLGVVEPGAVEGARLDRHQELDRSQGVTDSGPLIAGERIAAHLGNRVALQDPVGRVSVRLVAYPAHCSSPPVKFGYIRRKKSIIAALTSSGRSCWVQCPQPGRMIVPRSWGTNRDRLGTSRSMPRKAMTRSRSPTM